MFKPKECLVCPEKENRIADLKEQISYLRNVLHPKDPKPEYISPRNMEESVLLSGGGQEEIDPNSQELLDTPEVLAERESMLSGTY